MCHSLTNLQRDRVGGSTTADEYTPELCVVSIIIEHFFFGDAYVYIIM